MINYRCIPKILDSPVDGPTLSIMTDEDVAMLGLNLPSQRKKLLQEIKLFKQLGAPQVPFFLPPLPSLSLYWNCQIYITNSHINDTLFDLFQRVT
jgi:hypothetical protein